jgi:hypothetical protein
MAYVELKDRVLVPTGISEVITVNDRPHTTTPYFLMPLDGGKKLLLVMAETQDMEKHLLGPIDGLTERSRKEVVDKIVEKNPGLAGEILPLSMNADAAFTVIGWIVLVLFGPFVLLCTFNVIRALLRRDPVAPTATPSA